MTTTERRERLPKWAQELIARLERRVVDLRTELENKWASTLKTDQPRIEIGYGEWLARPERYIRADERVCFHLGTGLSDAFEVRLNPKSRVLHIQGGRSVRIVPSASNSFMVEFDEAG